MWGCYDGNSGGDVEYWVGFFDVGGEVWEVLFNHDSRTQ